MKVNIIGSCVSRDVFGFESSSFLELGFYVARTSLASAFHGDGRAPDNLTSRVDNIESPFQRRMVSCEINKELPKLISSSPSDQIIVLDLIDERFHLLRVEGVLYSRSGEFQKLGGLESKLEAKLSFQNRPELDEWKAGVAELLRLAGTNRIVLNKAKWASNNELDEVCWNEEEVSQANRTLEYMYAYIEGLGVTKVIEYPTDLIKIDSSHKWGVSPFHYIPSFYQHAMQELERHANAHIASLLARRVEDDYGRLNLPVLEFGSVNEMLEGIAGRDCICRVGAGPRVISLMVRGAAKLVDKNTRRVLVCFSGAVTTRGSTIPPYFSGAGLYSDLGVPVISISDPSLNLDGELRLAWYAGNCIQPDIPETISSIVQGLHEKFGVRPVLVGGSGGGFASLAQLQLGNYPLSALVWNPQTDIAAYESGAVAEYVSTAFPAAAEKSDTVRQNSDASSRLAGYTSIFKELGVRSRLSFADVARGRDVELVYLQNHTDWHLSKHASPYFGIKDSGRGLSSDFVQDSRVRLLVGDWGHGHAPPPRELISHLAGMLFQEQSLDEIAAYAKVAQLGNPVENSSEPGEPLHVPVEDEIFAVTSRNGTLTIGLNTPESARGRMWKYAVYLLNRQSLVERYWYQDSPTFKLDISGLAVDGVRYFIREGQTVLAMLDVPVAEASLETELLEHVINGGAGSRLPYIPDDFPPADLKEIGGGFDVSLSRVVKTRIFIDSSGNVEWMQNFPSNANSSRMWLVSLDLVGRICSTAAIKNSQKYGQLAADTFSDFYDFSSTAEGHDYIYNAPSADHAAATRIKVLVKCLMTLPQVGVDLGRGLASRVVSEVYSTSLWLADPVNFKVNNHGLMGAISLVVAGQYLGEIGKQFSLLGTERVVLIARSMFDSDGLCDENTIGYHNFNLTLYKQAIKFFSDCGLEYEGLRELSCIVERAEIALRHCLRTDSTVPPIGDSPVYPLGYESIPKSKVFPESGFAVLKTEDFYLTLICGGRTETHKQMDDSSITLRYKGVDVIIDAGSYSYDRTAGFGRYVESASGHSGVFPIAFDEMRRREVLKSFGPVVGGVAAVDSPAGEERVECFYGIDNKLHIRRSVSVAWPASLRLVDKVDLNELGGAVSQRFLLGPDFVPTQLDDGRIRLVSPTLTAVLSHSGSSLLRMVEGMNEVDVRGWYSLRFGEISKTWFIELLMLGDSASVEITFE